MSNVYLSKQMLLRVYGPVVGVITATLMAKPAWLPYTVTLILAICIPNAIYASMNSKATGSPVLKVDTLQEFPLTKKTVISSNTAIYRFALPTPTSILGLPIGQHISISANLEVPSDPKDASSPKVHKDIVRSYTPISGDHEPGHFDLLIKAYPTGNISKFMAGLELGQTIRVKGPKGAMVYTPNMVRHFGMIAGGTGITPMLQIIRAVIRGRSKGDRTEIDLIFANVNVEDILLKDDLDQLAREDSGFRVHYVLNNAPENWTGGVGFVTSDMIQKFLPQPAADTKILLCGPPPMISAMKKASESLGWQKARPVSKLEDQVFSF